MYAYRPLSQKKLCHIVKEGVLICAPLIEARPSRYTLSSVQPLGTRMCKNCRDLAPHHGQELQGEAAAHMHELQLDLLLS